MAATPMKQISLTVHKDGCEDIRITLSQMPKPYNADMLYIENEEEVPGLGKSIYGANLFLELTGIHEKKAAAERA